MIGVGDWREGLTKKGGKVYVGINTFSEGDYVKVCWGCCGIFLLYIRKIS
jgi:hypothetical protein